MAPIIFRFSACGHEGSDPKPHELWKQSQERKALPEQLTVESGLPCRPCSKSQVVYYSALSTWLYAACKNDDNANNNSNNNEPTGTESSLAELIWARFALERRTPELKAKKMCALLALAARRLRERRVDELEAVLRGHFAKGRENLRLYLAPGIFSYLKRRLARSTGALEAHADDLVDRATRLADCLPFRHGRGRRTTSWCPAWFSSGPGRAGAADQGHGARRGRPHRGRGGSARAGLPGRDVASLPPGVLRLGGGDRAAQDLWALLRVKAKRRKAKAMNPAMDAPRVGYPGLPKPGYLQAAMLSRKCIILVPQTWGKEGAAGVRVRGTSLVGSGKTDVQRLLFLSLSLDPPACM
ncbi:hypothetical protein PG994_006726 [Apiospora phragmitis]|uniref:Uncharacterized protein n=1 Tax=Apiospora phragmitis TaxID=2905665 RepID=A0ABR1VFY9_9PEZI